MKSLLMIKWFKVGCLYLIISLFATTISAQENEGMILKIHPLNTIPLRPFYSNLFELSLETKIFSIAERNLSCEVSFGKYYNAGTLGNSRYDRKYMAGNTLFSDFRNDGKYDCHKEQYSFELRYFLKEKSFSGFYLGCNLYYINRYFRGQLSIDDWQFDDNYRTILYEPINYDVNQTYFGKYIIFGNQIKLSKNNKHFLDISLGIGTQNVKISTKNIPQTWSYIDSYNNQISGHVIDNLAELYDLNHDFGSHLSFLIQIKYGFKITKNIQTEYQKFKSKNTSYKKLHKIIAKVVMKKTSLDFTYEKSYSSTYSGLELIHVVINEHKSGDFNQTGKVYVIPSKKIDYNKFKEYMASQGYFYENVRLGSGSYKTMVVSFDFIEQSTADAYLIKKRKENNIKKENTLTKKEEKVAVLAGGVVLVGSAIVAGLKKIGKMAGGSNSSSSNSSNSSTTSNTTGEDNISKNKGNIEGCVKRMKNKKAEETKTDGNMFNNCPCIQYSIGSSLNGWTYFYSNSQNEYYVDYRVKTDLGPFISLSEAIQAYCEDEYK